MTQWQTARIHGQRSFLLRTRLVDLALTEKGAHMGPVTFFPEDPCPIRPYAIAPWAEEVLPIDTPAVLTVLRGDWFCSAFGLNVEPYAERQLPVHGETANGLWYGIDHGETCDGCWLRMGIELPIQGGRCEATTALLNDQSVIYQRHDFSGLNIPINPGHHATLAFRDAEGAARLSFSQLKYAHTYVCPTERAENQGYSYLKPDQPITDLNAVPCIDGSMTDLSRYPARRGYDDIAILCADPTVELGWSAATIPNERFVWFSLRNPQQLVSTVLWFSNGGRYYSPWNGRVVNVLGIEDVTAFFHAGLAASIQKNVLNENGVCTFLKPEPGGQLSICYIQGVARVPDGFDRVARIESLPNRKGVVLIAESGVVVEVPCEIEFLHRGTLPQLEAR